MYTAQTEPVAFTLPWQRPFAERMQILKRGSPRAAYFYSWPDTSTFRYRAYNISQSLAATAAPNRPSAAWFGDEDLERMDRVLDACDVLVLCRNTLYHEGIARLAAMARARGRRILFDCDDLVFDSTYIHLVADTLGEDLRHEKVWNHWFAYIGRIAATYALCDGALVTNSFLADRAAAWSGKPVRVLPNYLNREQQDVSDRIWDAKEADHWDTDGRIHIGYFSGSPSHGRDFALVSPVIARLMDEDDRIWFRGVGFLDIPPEMQRHRARVESIPLQDFVNLQREIGAVEINLAPLQDNLFTNCKSELKWFEAAIAGALTVASPTFTFRDVVQQGRNGWLAESYAWEGVLRDLVQDFTEQRADVAPRARADARERYGWDRQTERIKAALFADW